MQIIDRRNPALKFQKATELPVDFLKTLRDAMTEAYPEALVALSKDLKNPRFHASGALYPDEVIVLISLVSDGRLSATTVKASCDFTLGQEKPSVEELLSKASDLIQGFWDPYLTGANFEPLLSEALSAFEDGSPFDWTPNDLKTSPETIFIKLDRSNPLIDELTEKWIDENDPELHHLEVREVTEQEEFMEERIEHVRSASGKILH